jgi:MFS family permease
VNPTGVYCALVLISFLNYTDRAILPGSANEFLRLISSTLSTDRPDIYLGILQSSFIIGFSFASIIVGHLVHFRGPFYLCAAGLGLWVTSTILSGVGFYLESFVLLLIGRMMSGIGEASFVCIAPPWIAKYAPEGRKGRWLAIFYTALPVGTAFGYSYAAFIANSLGVHWAFFMESMAMLPLIAILLTFAPHYPSCPSIHVKPDEQLELSNAPAIQLNIAASDLPVDCTVLNPVHEVSEEAETQEQISETKSLPAVKYNEAFLKSSQHVEAPTMLEEFWTISSSPSYVCITAGEMLQFALIALCICI